MHDTVFSRISLHQMVIEMVTTSARPHRLFAGAAPHRSTATLGLRLCNKRREFRRREHRIEIYCCIFCKSLYRS